MLFNGFIFFMFLFIVLFDYNVVVFRLIDFKLGMDECILLVKFWVMVKIIWFFVYNIYFVFFD